MAVQFGAAVQAPLLQIWPPLHLTPHPPQLLASVLVLTSQPSAKFLLQSAKPGLHTATEQAPA